MLRLPHQVTGEQKELVEDFRLDTVTRPIPTRRHKEGHSQQKLLMKVQVQIKHGDVVVLGSDGLFDNLSDEEH